MSVPSSNVATTCEKPNFDTERSCSSPGKAAQSLLDRESDLPLDLFGTEGRRDRVDLHLHGRRVGEGVDVEPCQRDDAGRRGRRHRQQHQHAVPQ